jgi:hypothetical protein
MLEVKVVIRVYCSKYVGSSSQNKAFKSLLSSTTVLKLGLGYCTVCCRIPSYESGCVKTRIVNGCNSQECRSQLVPAVSPELLARLFDIILSIARGESMMQLFKSCWLLLIALDPLISPLQRSQHGCTANRQAHWLPKRLKLPEHKRNINRKFVTLSSCFSAILVVR